MKIVQNNNQIIIIKITIDFTNFHCIDKNNRTVWIGVCVRKIVILIFNNKLP